MLLLPALSHTAQLTLEPGLGALILQLRFGFGSRNDRQDTFILVVIPIPELVIGDGHIHFPGSVEIAGRERHGMYRLEERADDKGEVHWVASEGASLVGRVFEGIPGISVRGCERCCHEAAPW
jgi:hypothetical protein